MGIGVTAHQRDDFAETALMQLKRGSRSPFYGINKTGAWNGLKIIRPLLGVRKRTLVEYCARRKIVYGIDETNADPKKAERNSVRKEIELWDDSRFESFMKFVEGRNATHLAANASAHAFYEE